MSLDFVVQDGDRQLSFRGELLAESNSKRQGQARYVAFALYRTAAGSYVISRRGISTLYHTPDCDVVRRNSLHPGKLSIDSVPCALCEPHVNEPEVTFVERTRYWAQVAPSAGAVLDLLHQEDSAGAWYLTNVARALLAAAAETDADVRREYLTEHVE